MHLEILLGFKPNILNISSSKIIAKVENLIVPFSESIPVTFTKDNYLWLIERYFNYFDIKNLKIHKYRLYLSRNHISPGRRSVINELEVTAFLLDHNFIILKGDEPINKVIEYFYNAELIIGYHGSMFTNTIFCQSLVRILEFCADNRVVTNLATKYKLANNHIHKIIKADENFNANLDLEMIREFIDT
jgi:capsular polysaccharide biosynthesis protein